MPTATTGSAGTVDPAVMRQAAQYVGDAASGNFVQVAIDQFWLGASQELTIIDAHLVAGLKQAAIYVGFIIIIAVCIYVIVKEG